MRPALIALALLAPATAYADTTADQAQSLEHQLHDWIGGLVGTVVGIPDRPVQLTPEGDHYKVAIPFQAAAEAVGFDAAGATVTADARPLAGDRWALDDISIPADLHITGSAGGTGPALDWSMKIEAQQISAVIDPSFTTASSLDADVHGQVSTGKGTGGAHTSQIAHYIAHTVLLPIGDGRVDMLGNTTGEKLEVSETTPDGLPIKWSAEHVRSNVRVDALAAGSLAGMMRTVMQMVPVAIAAQQSGQPSSGVPPEARQGARDVVMQLRNLWSGFNVDETLDTMQIEAAGQAGSISRLGLGFVGATRQGKLDLRMNVAADGIDAPDIFAGPLHDFAPHHIAFRPHVFGVPIDDATQLVLRAIDNDGASMDMNAEAMALLHKSPVTVGLDNVELDIGSSRLRGSGEVHLAGDKQVSGQADITVVGLDALMKQAAAVPELKQALPFLIMAKGLGKQEGNTTHWKIVYNGRKIMVNDNDLSGMLPGGKP